MTDLIRATITVDGREEVVHLARVGLPEGDPRPWRVEAPGARFDGWLVADADLRDRQ